MDYRFASRVASLKPSAIREILKNTSDSDVISFAAGNPAPESFPVEQMARISADLYAHHAAQALQYGVTEGYEPLRAALRQRLRDAFGCGGPDDELIVVSGAQQGIDLSCKSLCNEGDTVLCETPSFIGALNAFRSYGVRLCGIPMQPDGVDVERLERALETEPNVKLIYLIPTFQNPTGATMSLQKRLRVLELAGRYGVPVIEDNPYADLRFSGDPVPVMKSMDTDGAVIYCGSFSKILSAGIRVGFVLGPKPIVQKIVVCKQTSDVHTNLFFQMVAHRFITECDLGAHIRKIQGIYRRKCGLMVSEMEKKFDKSVTFTRPEGGMFLWCTLPEGADAAAFCKKAAAEGVAVVPGSAFSANPGDPCRSIRLNYSTPSDEQIVKGIGILGRLTHEL